MFNRISCEKSVHYKSSNPLFFSDMAAKLKVHKVEHRPYDLEVGHIQKVIAVSKDEYMAIPLDPEEFYLKYSVSRDEWSHYHLQDSIYHSDNFDTVEDAFFDPQTNAIRVVTQSSIQTVDVATMRLQKELEVFHSVDAGSGTLVYDGHTVHARDYSGEYQLFRFCGARSSIIGYTNNSYEDTLLCLSEYSVSSKQERKWAVELPRDDDLIFGDGIGTAFALSGRYFMCFGANRDSKIADKICVMDLELQTYSECSLNHPLKGSFQGIVMEGDSELPTFGFVRRAFGTPEFKDVQMMPHYLIEMIAQWFSNAHLYIVGDGSMNCDHFRIKLDDI